MKNILRITTSISGESSVSSQLMDELSAGLAASEAIELIERDFSVEPIPHLDSAWLTALSTAQADRDEGQQKKVEYSDGLIAELQKADVLLLGLPMYNFSVPSMLKAWIDHIARAGVTFRYTDNGPVGMLQGKKVYLVAAMGGESGRSATDFLRPYMRHILSFIGLSEVEFITAEGLNLGPERRQQGLAEARRMIDSAVGKYRQEMIEQEVAA